VQPQQINESKKDFRALEIVQPKPKQEQKAYSRPLSSLAGLVSSSSTSVRNQSVEED